MIRYFLALLVLAGERIEQDTSTHTNSQINGVVASCHQQPHPLKQIEHVEGPCQLVPLHSTHVERCDHRPGNVPREEEEERHVADRKIGS